MGQTLSGNNSAGRLNIRSATSADVPELCALLNDIIREGGTTAMESPLDETDFQAYFLQEPEKLSCFVAIESTGILAGFQSVTRHPKLPDKWGDIATFARMNSTARGVGTALFEKTSKYAREQGLVAINATIRADNVPGLAYYKKMGFVDYSVATAVPLKDGTRIDRISRKYILD